MVVFVYGTLLSPGMEHRCAAPRFLGKAVLPAHNLMMANGYPTVLPGDGHVHGEVYEVTEEDSSRLDRYESYPNFYLKKEVTVETDDNPELTATVYYQPANIVKSPQIIASGKFRNT